ncbi:MAG: DUF2225 domain-containing protein [Defluviitaleaceae bacterium]|nr:DUF2225 domain-containing protein [Defluviitaleaceae bacterium]
MSDKKEITPPTQEEILSFLYPRNIKCPVCEREFTDFGVRTTKLRVEKMDNDFRKRYYVVDPNHYGVTLCYHCGYTAIHAYFERITEKQQDLIKKFITPLYKPQEYHVPLSQADVLNRYDQALACCQAIYAKDSQFAFTYLKKAWVYRDMENMKDREIKEMREAYIRFKDAFTSESFPLGEMDEITAKYLIAELARRLGNFAEALRWVGDVVVAKGIPSAIKERAVILKELAREGNMN